MDRHAVFASLGIDTDALTGGTLPVTSPIDGAEIARLGESNRAVRAVIQHFRGPLICARLQKVNADPAWFANNVVAINPEPAKLGDATIRKKIVVGKRCHERTWNTVV